MKKIQLAFQGGGAKIVTLLAVAEAIQKLQRENRLEVKRIAGTSAGAIVGAFLAAGVDIVEVRTELANGKAAELVSAFPPLKFLTMAWKAWRGSHFWSTKSLEEWLNSVFQRVHVHTIGDCKEKTQTELIVMSTNLTDGKMEPSREGDVLVTSLLESCALPFCFRPFSKGGGKLIVDGGIGENLPVEQLSREVTGYGEIFAITFSRASPRTPQSAQSYAASLLSTAMNVSVNRARDLLPKNRLYEIESGIGTFEFAKITKEWFEKEYRAESNRALQFFSTLKIEAAEIDPWSVKEPVLKRIMTDLASLYNASEAKRPLIYDEVVLEATARCLLDSDGYDQLKCRLVFRPVRDSIGCHAISLAGFGGREYYGRIDPKLRDACDRPIACTAIPSLPSRKTPGVDLRQVLLFFEELLSPDRGPYTLKFQDEAPRIMGPLRDTGVDQIGLQLPRAEGKIGRTIIALHVPEAYSNIKILKSPQGGRALTGNEEDLLNRPRFFRTIAWAADNLAPEEMVVEYQNVT